MPRASDLEIDYSVKSKYAPTLSSKNERWDPFRHNCLAMLPGACPATNNDACHTSWPSVPNSKLSTTGCQAQWRQSLI